jgi:3-dehydroquinate synthase
MPRSSPTPTSLTVGASEPYDVLVEPGLDLAAALSERLRPGVAALLTDSTVARLHGPKVLAALGEAGWEVRAVVEVPPGEGSKSLAVYEGAVRELARAGLPRGATLFALGGGVVGDLGGFVASSYMRGIGFVQLPTTLLAMVDSSVGGKVGLDLPEGKNLVGAFYQPRLVVADLHWLATLPPRELSGGLAEVVKMALLAGGEFLDDVSGGLGAARSGDGEALRALILHSVAYKARVVAADERESGLRAVLNYGHTTAHGLEAAASYGLPHGEAVAVGMLAAARLSERRFGTELLPLHERLVRAAGLPTRVPAVDPEAVLEAMRRDKKRGASDGPGEHRFVLLRAPGEPVVNVPVPEDEAREAVEAVLEP